ncbi:inositol monophosphatase family protein [Curtobacterium ammoniigenes]|uniref:inositol monophosphatase family protein n=1 Tax=Curtobacterium ammoniigenes TaxID=395387 RepID=UPI0008326BC6|nr:inositol monophosphatase family protein [Curtobacterium ammoniigenes]
MPVAQPLDQSELRQLAELAERIARQAGEIAVRRRAEGVEVADRKSSIVDVVTAADREVEAFIRGAIAAARPADGFLGEETGAAAGASGLTWVVDPIDGTVNYLYGSTAYGISIAVVAGEPDPARWTPLVGVVVVPAIDVVYRAVAGGGATRNGTSLGVAAPASLAETMLATGFGYTADRRRQQIAVLGPVVGAVRDIRRVGAASVDFCSVADGTVDAYYERGLNPWDMAAGALVATEAGAALHTWDASGVRAYLVAAPGVDSALLTLIRDAEAAVLGSGAA